MLESFHPLKVTIFTQTLIGNRIGLNLQGMTGIVNKINRKPLFGEN